MITGEQVKAARKLLGWDRSRLAMKAGIGETVLRRFEDGESPPLENHLRFALRRALEFASVEFPEGEPPRLKTGGATRATCNHPP